MSRALTSLPIGEANELERRAQDQRQLGLGNTPARVASDSDRLTGADDPAGCRLEEEFGPLCSVDQIVKRGRLVGFLLAGHLAPFVGDTGTPNFLVVQRRQHSNRVDRERGPRAC